MGEEQPTGWDQGMGSARVVAGCSTTSKGWEGIFVTSIGAAAAEPSLARTIQGEAGRNVGTVPGLAASLPGYRKVLSSQPYPVESAFPGSLPRRPHELRRGTLCGSRKKG